MLPYTGIDKVVNKPTVAYRCCRQLFDADFHTLWKSACNFSSVMIKNSSLFRDGNLHHPDYVFFG